ncbi:MAG: 5-(carboxyamino)imidazole ribonucleotide synthase [Kiritimatiellae bacterium]|nr:5-(carboxyamino)imidazole ribonucleotide synthase [Kiritimatiellia bacterium]MDW8459150.1 5-(carboxyamino)imidazole ribonucleotide synthase [Verrucomicrobiota bacterium]
MDRPIIGILGGGQLAKMMAQAAYRLGCIVRVLERKPTHPPLLGWESESGDWNDPDTLIRFAARVDVITVENEFINADALAELEAEGHRLYPPSDCLARVQDKLTQKQTLQQVGLPIPTFLPVQSPEDVLDAASHLGWPIVLKRRTLGYDGKGNATLNTPADLPMAWARLGGDSSPLFVEQFCQFQKEIAVMVTRSPDGTLATYPVVDTVQRDHICHTVTAPADLSPSKAAEAARLATAAVEAIGGIGSVGVEMFYMPDGRILINELAPRVHNSGHYTIEACYCSQFENHIRAILGWPLGSTSMSVPAAAMVNLLGAGDGPGWPSGLVEALAVPGVYVHIYGKDRSAKGRKMGHVTALGADPHAALATALRAASQIRFG